MKKAVQDEKMNAKSGQGMTEYIIIIAVIAIASIVVFGLFGSQIKHTVQRLAGGLSGEEVTAEQQIEDGDWDDVDMGSFSEGATQ